MVKKLVRFFLVLSLCVTTLSSAWAASLTASVDRKNIAVGESFVLELRLADASPKGGPDFSVLEDSFIVYSTGQSSQTSVVNGKLSSSISWHATLISRKEGELTIPAISIEAESGAIKSQPVVVNVTKTASSAKAEGGDEKPFYVDTQVSKRAPFKNEPVVVTYKMVTGRSINGISVSDLSVPDAITELQGTPEVYDAVLGGKRVKVVEARYLVTPLKDGKLTISGLTFQGNVESEGRQDPLSRSFARRLNDPFSLFEFSLPGMSSFDPFALSGEDIVLDVKKPAANIDPWLPAKNVEISDKWEGEVSAKIGEPLTRKLVIVADGLAGTALPTLEDSVDPQGDFKIYADKPVTGENISEDGLSINGWREEAYTMIPQKAGKVTLPEIKLAWWDVTSNSMAYATVPEKTIDVKYGAFRSDVPAATAQKTEENQSAPGTETLSAQPQTQLGTEAGEIRITEQQAAPSYMYGIIAVLCVLLMVMTGVIIYLFNRIELMKKNGIKTQHVPRPANSNKSRISLDELKKAKTAEELREFVQSYAVHHWDLPKNASLPSIASWIQEQGIEKEAAVLRDIDAALYAGGTIDCDAAKEALKTLIKAVAKASGDRQGDGEQLQQLNPS